MLRDVFNFLFAYILVLSECFCLDQTHGLTRLASEGFSKVSDEVTNV